MRHFRLPHAWLEACDVSTHTDTFPVLNHIVYSGGSEFVVVKAWRWGIVTEWTVNVARGVFV